MNVLKDILLKEQNCSDCWARYLCGGECLAEKIWDNKKQKKLRCELKKHICKLKIYIYYKLITSGQEIDYEKFNY